MILPFVFAMYLVLCNNTVICKWTCNKCISLSSTLSLVQLYRYTMVYLILLNVLYSNCMVVNSYTTNLYTMWHFKRRYGSIDMALEKHLAERLKGKQRH